MSEPVTAADLTTATGPLRGKIDLLDQRVTRVEKAHDLHLEEAVKDRDELREVRDWMIRADSRSAQNVAWIKALSGGTLLGFITLLLAMLDLLRRVGA